MKLSLVFTLLVIFAGVMMTIAQETCFCIDEYKPVCGANGVTYTNACRAGCEGQRVYRPGEC